MLDFDWTTRMWCCFSLLKISLIKLSGFCISWFSCRLFVNWCSILFIFACRCLRTGTSKKFARSFFQKLFLLNFFAFCYGWAVTSRSFPGLFYLIITHISLGCWSWSPSAITSFAVCQIRLINCPPKIWHCYFLNYIHMDDRAKSVFLLSFGQNLNSLMKQLFSQVKMFWVLIKRMLCSLFLRCVFFYPSAD